MNEAYRIETDNRLYLLLVHLVKFGEMYLGGVSSTMRKILSKR